VIKKFLHILVLSYATVIFSEEEPMARVIDLGKMDVSCIPGYKALDLSILAEEYSPFNGAIELCTYFHYLQDTFRLDTAIETGTSEGKTSAFLAFLFDKVHTTDIDVSSFQNALIALRPYSNIEVHYGDSPFILRQILPSKKNNRLLFYLDAHSSNNKWPLLEELEVIAQTHRDNCIIVINDFKIPGRNDIPYYAVGKKECSYEYIKSQLNKVFSSYVYYYVIPKSVNAGAKFVAIPKKRDFSSGWAQ